MVNTIWFRFDLIRFRKYFSVGRMWCKSFKLLWNDVQLWNADAQLRLPSNHNFLQGVLLSAHPSHTNYISFLSSLLLFYIFFTLSHRGRLPTDHNFLEVVLFSIHPSPTYISFSSSFLLFYLLFILSNVQGSSPL